MILLENCIYLDFDGRRCRVDLPMPNGEVAVTVFPDTPQAHVEILPASELGPESEEPTDHHVNPHVNPHADEIREWEWSRGVETGRRR